MRRTSPPPARPRRGRCALRRRLLAGVAACAAALAPPAARAQEWALRFFGNGVNDIDRVKIRIDDPANALPGPPADVGATDFTIELWLRATAAENPAPAVSCGSDDSWIFGHTVVDRDRFNQGRKFGLSIAGSSLAFGVTGATLAAARTICGSGNVADGLWHHVAVQRRRSDGFLWIWLDGALDASADGPDGDVSYPDDGVPGDFCGGPCTGSDPFLVLGAEKHDAGAQFPSFSGSIDEVRISTVLRYAAPFSRPTAPFVSDADTAALYHLDEGTGDDVGDLSGAPGGPSPGVRRFGGSPAGPLWVVSDAPIAVPEPGRAPGGLAAGALLALLRGGRLRARRRAAMLERATAAAARAAAPWRSSP